MNSKKVKTWFVVITITLLLVGCKSTDIKSTETTEYIETTETTSIEAELEETEAEIEYIETESIETELPVESTEQKDSTESTEVVTESSTNPNNANIPKEDYQWYRDTFGLTDEQIANLTQEEHDKMVVDWFNSLGGSGGGSSSSGSSGNSSGLEGNDDDLPTADLIPDDEVDAGHM